MRRHGGARHELVLWQAAAPPAGPARMVSGAPCGNSHGLSCAGRLCDRNRRASAPFQPQACRQVACVLLQCTLPGPDCSVRRGQVRVLAVRTVRFYVRNPELVLAKLFTYVFMGCFMGAHAACCPWPPSVAL